MAVLAEISQKRHGSTRLPLGMARADHPRQIQRRHPPVTLPLMGQHEPTGADSSLAPQPSPAVLGIARVCSSSSCSKRGAQGLGAKPPRRLCEKAVFPSKPLPWPLRSGTKFPPHSQRIVRAIARTNSEADKPFARLRERATPAGPCTLQENTLSKTNGQVSSCSFLTPTLRRPRNKCHRDRVFLFT